MVPTLCNSVACFYIIIPQKVIEKKQKTASLLSSTEDTQGTGFDKTIKFSKLRAKRQTETAGFYICLDVYKSKIVAKKSQISRVFIVKDAYWR